MGFLVGFNRNRDSYQAALAFAEDNSLDRLITDYYVGKTRPGIPTLSHRSTELIPPSMVTLSPAAFIRQLPYELKRHFRNAHFPSESVERLLGATIARAAKKQPDSDLFLYSGSAEAAFAGPSKGRRVLFQYHPSPSYIAKITSSIDELGNYRHWEEEEEVIKPSMETTHLAEVSLADKAVCASTFTKQGLISIGMSPENITVVPYGCPKPDLDYAIKADSKCSFLFIGQGVKRKGLHLLIEAWRQAKLKQSNLTIVASRLDPEIRDFAKDVNNITIKGRLDAQLLRDEMRRCDSLVLPSLVEGFGLVLGESLAFGCRLIGSTNTGLVDMKLPADVSTVVQAGLVSPLIEALKASESSFNPLRPYRDLALAEADRLSWASFRAGIRASAGCITPVAKGGIQ